MPTNNNLKNVFIGRLDLDCNPNYINEHFNEINKTIRSRHYRQIFSSPLKRARQSTSVFFPNMPYIVDRRLIERDLGDWKNKPKSDVRCAYPDAFFKGGNLNFNYTPPGGEKFEDVLKRVSSFILDVYDNYGSDDEIAIVTHNGIITAVKCLINGTTSTENIEFQPFLKEYVVEISDDFLELLDSMFSTF